MSKLTVDTIEPSTGNTVTLGASGDTFTVPSGVTLSGAGAITVPSGGSLTIDSGATITNNGTNGGGFGKVLQVVSTTLNTVQSTTSTTFIDITGFNVSITPSSTSSKILIMCDIIAASDGGGGHVQLTRGGTPIAIGTGATGSRINATTGLFYNSGDNNVPRGQSFSYLDSPSTTSATTYQVQWRKGTSGTFVLNRNVSNNNAGYTGYYISTITAMEIAG